MSTRTAFVTSEGDETVVRISGRVRLASGPVAIREIEATGELILAPLETVNPPDTWTSFFARLNQRPGDPRFMSERPMNRIPLEKDLFGDD